MGNQVTVKIDSRFFYGLVAIIAVVGIFAIGWWLGKQLPGGSQPVVQTGEAQPPNVVVPGGGLEVVPGAPAAPQPGAPDAAPALDAGKPPVSVDEIPVGEAEARLWIDELSAESNYTYDLGQISGSEPTEKDFTITNVGTAELVIGDASASCGCTAAVVEDGNLGPGESTIIRVSYDPRVNKEQGRFVQKQIRIRSNDTQAPLVEFSISADVASQ